MSIDNGGSQFGMDNPIGNVQQPKSKAKFWLFGGCGCLSMIALVCVGGGAFLWFQFGQPMVAFMNENVTLVETSPKAKEILGDPVTVDVSSPPQRSSSSGNFSFTYPISGPKAKGTYTFKGRMNPETFKFEGTENYIEVDGVKTDLDPDAMFEGFEDGIDDGN